MNENYEDKIEDENEEEEEEENYYYEEEDDEEEGDEEEEENYYFPLCEKCNELCRVHISHYYFLMEISCLNGHKNYIEIDEIKYKLLTKNDYDLKKENYKEYEVKSDKKLNFENQDLLHELFENILRKYYPDKENLFVLSSNENNIDKIDILINDNLKEEENNIIKNYLKKIYSFNYLLNSIKRSYNKLRLQLIETDFEEEQIYIIYPPVLNFIAKNNYKIPLNNILNVNNYINDIKNNDSAHFYWDEYITFCKYLPINDLICINSNSYTRCMLECCGAEYRRDDDKYSSMFIIKLNNKSFDRNFIDKVIQKDVAELKNNIIIYCSDFGKISIIKILPKSENNKAFKTLQVVEVKNKILEIFTCKNLLYINLENGLNLYKNISDEEKFEYSLKQTIDLQKNEKVLINNKKILIVNIKSKDLLNIKEYDLFLSDFINFNILCIMNKNDKINNISSNIIYIYNEKYVYFISLITHQVINKFTFENNKFKFIHGLYDNLILFQRENCVKIAKFDKKHITLNVIDEKILNILSDDLYSGNYVINTKNKMIFIGNIKVFLEEYGDYNFISEIKIFEYNNYK